MAISSTKLTMMPFPQHWDGAVLKLNMLVLPHEDPTAPFAVNIPPGVNAPEFANAKLKFNAMLIGSLDMMPRPADVTQIVPLNTTAPADSLSLFKQLAKSFNITKPSNVINPASAATFIQKYLPKSYRSSFSFSQPRTPYAKIDDSYYCAIKTKKEGMPKPVYSTDEVSWGKVFALALRQPVLARKLGFVYEVDVNLPAGVYQDGGWLYVDLDATSDYHAQILAQPDIVKRYAARIPSLSSPRHLFAAVQFPVSDLPVPGNYDSIFIEAEDYDDGFAKIVHCMQPVSANLLLEPGQESEGLPPTRDFGIRLCWDDEQLLIWQNRQMTIDPDLGSRLDAPMGIFNYRVDVRTSGEDDTKWNSLVKVQGELVLNEINLGNINAELGVEVGPVQLDGQKQGVFWLPSYFTQWTGASLIIKDERAAKLAGTDSILKKQMQPVDAEKVPLLYGETYDFRVRFADTTGGGPDEKDIPINGSPAPFATCRFRRYVPPQKVRVPGLESDQPPQTPPSSYKIYRPLLGYPSLLYTGLPNAYNLLLADFPNALAEKREAAYPDPDVSFVQIDVDIKALEMDTLLSKHGQESYYHLFSTIRSFPADLTQPFEMQVEFHDAAVVKFGDEADLGDLPLTTHTSPLRLPTSRDVRIRIIPVCNEDPMLAYFGSQETRFGKPVFIYTRAEARDERSLFINESPARQFQSILLQPDPIPTPNLAALMIVSGQATDTPANLFQRLAEQLQLDTSGTSLFAKPGKRVVFGCAKGIRHTLSPEHATITFANKTDLVHQWIPTIILDINRDWSWDGLGLISFEIKRGDTELVGVIELKNMVSITALKNADRSHTRIIFFDAVDPKEFPGAFPKPMELKYMVTAHFKKPPTQQDPDKELSMTVPVAVPPAQVPKIVSAGIALSPYVRSEDYSATEIRQKVLWVEFEEPVQNPDDDYFAFVKAYSPDPLLLKDNEPVQDPKENIPFLPPELIRVITAGQSDDRAGLNAWQQLVPCTEISPRHFIVPLPPGLNAESNELFGFFVYEFCVGHSRVWCTAQSRFGRAIRVTGVQHPAPQLTYSVTRTHDAIILAAPYATPVFEGRSLLPIYPQTEIWGVLYTQVMQVDGKDFRNILLREKRMIIERKHIDKERQEATKKYGICGWTQTEVRAMLLYLGLPENSPLSVMAIEMIPNFEHVNEPLSGDLGKMRIYRTSTLEPVPEICV
ncbi:MAG: hypothetical protein KJ077_02590 [Anaerolineae bacterium]|nr:hypothetical protein [Anaerolineae bacterium]